MESFLVFVLLAISSAIGGLAYLICHRVKPRLPFVWGTVALYGLCVALYCICIDNFFGIITGGIGGVILLIAAALLSNIGAGGHKALIDEPDFSLASAHNLTFTATLLSLIAGMACLFICNQFFVEIDESLSQLYVALLIGTPSLTPYLLWAAKSLQLRPGVDKHFDE